MENQRKKRALNKIAAEKPITKLDLYEFEIRLGQRIDTLQGSVTTLHDRMNAHDVNHNTAAGQQVVTNLDNVQKSGLGRFGGILALVVSAGTAIAVIVKSLISGGGSWTP